MAVADYASVAQQIYIAYFGRPADPQGLANVEAALNAAGAPTDAKGLDAAYNTNASIKTLIDSFGTSGESTSLYTGTTTTQFVNAIYHDLFNRGADLDGLKFWVDAIDSGTLTKAHAAQSILAGASTADAAIVAAKVTAAGNFTSALNTGDTLAAYNGDAAAAAARTLLSNVDASTDQIAFQTQINDTITTLVQGPSTVTNLTSTISSYVGTAGNDTFNAIVGATGSTWIGVDSIDGGKGVNTLNLTGTTATLDLTAGTITNIQNLNVVSAGAIVNGDVTGYTGLTNASFVVKAATGQTITAADTTAVTINNTVGGVTVNGGLTATVSANATATAAAAAALATYNGAVSGQAAAVAANTGSPTAADIATAFATGTGTTAADIALVNTFSTTGTPTVAQVLTYIGTIVANDQTASNTAAIAATNANVAISGEALTAATVVGGNLVSVDDQGNATLTSVSLKGNQGAATLTGDALTTVSVASTSQSVSIDNTTAKHTLGLTVNAVTGGTISDNVATTVNLSVAGAKASTASTFTLQSNDATAITVANAATLNLTVADSSLKMLTVTGAGTMTTDLHLSTSLTTIDASAATGTNTVFINPTVAAYIGGSGVDNVTVNAAATKVLDGGDGTADQIDFAGNNGTGVTGLLLNATNAAKYVNFEVLSTSGGAGSFDVSLLSGITSLQTGGNTGAVSFVNVAAGTDLTLVSAPGQAVTYSLVTDTGASDALTLHLGSAQTSGINFSGQTVTVGNIESLAIESNGKVDTDGSSVGINHISLSDAAVTTLTLTGAESLQVSGLVHSVTSIDASGIAAGAAVVIDGAQTATAGATVTIGDAALSFIGNAAAGKVDTITAGDGDNGITETTGNNVITLGNGDNTISAGAGNNTITVGTGQDSITVGAGQNTITLGVHTAADTINLGVAATANSYSSITGAVHGDTINLDIGNTHAGIFSGTAHTAASAQISLNATTAAFADYVLAATSAAGAATGSGQISWFNFGGNTYIVEDNNAGNGFVTGSDNIVQLTGTINLAATGSVATVTAGHVVL